MPCGTTESYNHQSFWWHPWTRGVNGSPHYGVDIFGKEGTDVHPAVGGIVIYSGWYGDISGNMVVVLGPKWKLHEYMHLKELDVHLGQFVTHKDVIGLLGRTGNASKTPAHVHYSIITCVPYPWLYNKEYGDGHQPKKFNWMKMFFLNPDEYLRQSRVINDRRPVTYGIDVSHRQGNIDWEKVSKDTNNIEFVFVKATEGATFFDPRLDDNVKGAHEAGLQVGAYHFFRMTSTPQEQFKSFNKCLKKYRKYLTILPVIDVETFDGKTSTQIKDSLDRFIELIHNEYGIYPIIYGPDIAPSRMMSKQVCDNCLFFIGQTESPEPRQKFNIWQYTSLAKVDGISTYVDMDKLHRDTKISDLKWK